MSTIVAFNNTSSQSEQLFSAVQVNGYFVKSGFIYRKLDANNAIKVNALLTGSIPASLTEVTEAVTADTVVRGIYSISINYITL